MQLGSDANGRTSRSAVKALAAGLPAVGAFVTGGAGIGNRCIRAFAAIDRCRHRSRLEVVWCTEYVRFWPIIVADNNGRNSNTP